MSGYAAVPPARRIARETVDLATPKSSAISVVV
jgi:hypothetical protein